MSRIPPTTRSGPAAVVRYLNPKEKLLATTRRHPAVLIKPSAQAVGGLLAATVLSATLFRNQTALIAIIWALWAVLMIRLVWTAINWFVDYFVITSERILLTSGVFTRDVVMLPLPKVQDMTFRRSVGGKILGYGQFVVESAGQHALSNIDHIPYPEQLYQIVCDKIFFKGSSEEEEDDGLGDATYSGAGVSDHFVDDDEFGDHNTFGGGIDSPDDL